MTQSIDRWPRPWRLGERFPGQVVVGKALTDNPAMKPEAERVAVRWEGRWDMDEPILYRCTRCEFKTLVPFALFVSCGVCARSGEHGDMERVEDDA